MVFVMGGRGFVGSAFVRLLAENGVEHEIVEYDNYHEFNGRDCDILINANGNSKKFLATKDPVAEFDASIRSVCHSLHNIKYGKYVLCSTCDVYNNFSDPAFNHEGVEINTTDQSRYGFHKNVAEEFVRYEAKDHLVIRFGGFIGPGLKKNPIFDILNGGPLWLDPTSRLQYIHTDVAAKVVWGLVEKGLTNEVFNLCGDGLVSLSDIMDHLGRSVPVQENSPRVVYSINIDKVKRHFAIPDSAATVYEFIDNYEMENA